MQPEGVKREKKKRREDGGSTDDELVGAKNEGRALPRRGERTRDFWVKPS